MRTLFILLCLVHLCFAILLHPISAADVTDSVEPLGNPTLAQYPDNAWTYARNVWEMQLFNGRIYLGSGNSSNFEPARSAGPVYLWYWDTVNNVFAKDLTLNTVRSNALDEEQLDRFTIIDGQACIPGHPMDNWEMGNFYTPDSNGWKKHRTIPDGIHCYDLYKFKGQLFAGPGSTGNSIGLSPGWYFGFYFHGILYWITPGGLSLTTAPLANIPPMNLNDLSLLNITLPPGASLSFVMMLADSSGLKAIDFITAAVPAIDQPIK